jgi:hypothetical protein
MTTATTPDCYGIVPADDLLHDLPNVPGWSENLQLVVNDSSAGVAFYVHFSRMVDDPGIWEGILICYLPDGQLRVRRGRSGHPGPGRAAAGRARRRRHDTPVGSRLAASRWRDRRGDARAELGAHASRAGLPRRR